MDIILINQAGNLIICQKIIIQPLNKNLIFNLLRSFESYFLINIVLFIEKYEICDINPQLEKLLTK